MNHTVIMWICYNKYSSYPINWFWHWLHDMWNMPYMYVHCFNFSVLCLPWYFKEEFTSGRVIGTVWKVFAWTVQAVVEKSLYLACSDFSVLEDFRKSGKLEQWEKVLLLEWK
jgi:hypothetical protein